MFIDPGYWGGYTWVDGNYHLLPDSPCIDAGDNTAVTPGVTTDLDGRPRFLDDLCTTDTGYGTPPIADMGAYEFAYAYFGDFDGDCYLDVNLVDFAIFALTWMLEAGETGYDPNCDISIPPDNYINWRDLDVFTDNWLAGN